MDYRFSKFAKRIIYFNALLTLFIGAFHCYNVYRMKVSNDKILAAMEASNVTRDTAIRMLERAGESLFINKELTTYFGIIVSIATLVLLYQFAKNNGFFFAISAAFCSMFTSLIGGLLLFYLIFSGKSEVAREKGQRKAGNSWESYIHEKSNDPSSRVQK